MSPSKKGIRIHFLANSWTVCFEYGFMICDICGVDFTIDEYEKDNGREIDD
jgi:hypothetical protein